jgi:cytochrome d ubiquinol oxidase subunit II
MPALYMPVTLMLLGLIFRGVAFEFRFKASGKQRPIWDTSFHAGSLLAAFMQGVILGNFVQGVDVDGRNFAGGALDWANGFAVVTGLSLIFGYSLLGATWLIMKTDGDTQRWARAVGRYVLVFVALSMAIVSLTMPFLDPRIAALWFTTPNIYYLAPIPLITALAFVRLWLDLRTERQGRPFLLTVALFLLGYIGLGISMYPWIVPFEFTLWEAAAAATSQSLVLIGTALFLPVILIYTGYCYYIFWGKTTDEAMY